MARQSSAPRVSPEQEEGVARKVGNAALGGLSAVGNVLDLPGSMVRDVLSLRNPVDQILTPFSSDNRTSGRDLLRNYGVVGDRDTWSNFIPGMALELAADPLTYATFGASALGKAGRAARAVGRLDDATKVARAKGVGKAAAAVGPREARATTSLNDLIEAAFKQELDGVVPMADGKFDLPAVKGSEKAPAVKLVDDLEAHAKASGFKSADDLLSKHGNEKLGSVVGYGLPFTGEVTPVMNDLTLKAAKVLDTVGETVGNSKVGIGAKALFSPRSGGFWTKEKQDLHGEFYDKSRPETVAARRRLRSAIQKIDEVSKRWNESITDPSLALNRKEVGELIGLTGELVGMDVDEAFNILKQRRTSKDVPDVLSPGDMLPPPEPPPSPPPSSPPPGPPSPSGPAPAAPPSQAVPTPGPPIAPGTQPLLPGMEPPVASPPASMFDEAPLPPPRPRGVQAELPGMSPFGDDAPIAKAADVLAPPATPAVQKVLPGVDDAAPSRQKVEIGDDFGDRQDKYMKLNEVMWEDNILHSADGVFSAETMNELRDSFAKRGLDIGDYGGAIQDWAEVFAKYNRPHSAQGKPRSQRNLSQFTEEWPLGKRAKRIGGAAPRLNDPEAVVRIIERAVREGGVRHVSGQVDASNRMRLREVLISNGVDPPAVAEAFKEWQRRQAGKASVASPPASAVPNATTSAAPLAAVEPVASEPLPAGKGSASKLMPSAEEILSKAAGKTKKRAKFTELEPLGGPDSGWTGRPADLSTPEKQIAFLEKVVKESAIPHVQGQVPDAARSKLRKAILANGADPYMLNDAFKQWQAKQVPVSPKKSKLVDYVKSGGMDDSAASSVVKLMEKTIDNAIAKGELRVPNKKATGPVNAANSFEAMRELAESKGYTYGKAVEDGGYLVAKVVPFEKAVDVPASKAAAVVSPQSQSPAAVAAAAPDPLSIEKHAAIHGLDDEYVAMVKDLADAAIKDGELLTTPKLLDGKGPLSHGKMMEYAGGYLESKGYTLGKKIFDGEIIRLQIVPIEKAAASSPPALPAKPLTIAPASATVPAGGPATQSTLPGIDVKTRSQRYSETPPPNPFVRNPDSDAIYGTEKLVKFTKNWPLGGTPFGWLTKYLPLKLSEKRDILERIISSKTIPHVQGDMAPEAKMLLRRYLMEESLDPDRFNDAFKSWQKRQHGVVPAKSVAPAAPEALIKKASGVIDQIAGSLEPPPSVLQSAQDVLSPASSASVASKLTESMPNASVMEASFKDIPLAPPPAAGAPAAPQPPAAGTAPPPVPPPTTADPPPPPPTPPPAPPGATPPPQSMFPEEIRKLVQEAAMMLKKQSSELIDDIESGGIDVSRVRDTDAASYMERSVASGVMDEIDRARNYSLRADELKARTDLIRSIPKKVIEDIARNMRGEPIEILRNYGKFLLSKGELDAVLGGADAPHGWMKGAKKHVVERLEAARKGAMLDRGKIVNDVKHSWDSLPRHIKDQQPFEDLFDEVASGVQAVPSWVSNLGKEGLETLRRAAGVDKKELLRDLRNHQAARLASVSDLYQKGTKAGFAKGHDLYEDITTTLGKNYHQLHRARAARDSIFDFFSRAVDPEAVKGVPSEKMVPLFEETLDAEGNRKIRSAFKMAGFDDPKRSLKSFSQKTGISEEVARVMQVPESWVAAAKATYEKVKPPEHERVLGAVSRHLTKAFKENVTLPFPGFHGRNYGSGQVGMNYAMADVIHDPKDAAAYAKYHNLAAAMLKNPSDPAYKKWMDEIWDNDIPNYGHASGDVELSTAQVTGSGTPTSAFDWRSAHKKATEDVHRSPWSGFIPELSEKSKLGGVARAARKALDFVDEKVRIPHRTALEVGGNVAANTEWMNRVPLHLYLREHLGWSAEQAAKKVRDIHVDYGDLTPFEQSARTAIPFYTFTKKMAAQTAKGLVENPGGPMATAIKVTNRSRNPSELTPDYVAETTSIPLGESEDGTKRYITGFGMPWEDPLSFLGKGVRGAGLELMSRGNPLIKGPAEYASGVTYFQSTPDGGRQLVDADPSMGRLAANLTGRQDAYKFGELPEAVVSNSPVTRYLTTARQLTDPRKDILDKAVNLLTGVRITDVSPASQDAILRERVQQALRDTGGRTFVRSYLPDHIKERMTPQQLAEAREYEATLNTLADRAKKRKAELQSK